MENLIAIPINTIIAIKVEYFWFNLIRNFFFPGLAPFLVNNLKRNQNRSEEVKSLEERGKFWNDQQEIRPVSAVVSELETCERKD